MEYKKEQKIKDEIRKILTGETFQDSLGVLAELMAEFEERSGVIVRSVENGINPEFYWNINRHEFFTLYWADGVANSWQESFATEDLARSRLAELQESVMYQTEFSNHNYLGTSY
jgi:uncharacterized protein Yka (UPF0111/DUF47 family)